MLKIQPITELEAPDEIKNVYTSIKQIIGLTSTPLLFQYLANFPVYLSYVWNQATMHITDSQFLERIRSVEIFTTTAFRPIYTPSYPLLLFLKDIGDNVEHHELLETSRRAVHANTVLYLLSLMLREGIKGKYLGLKQLSGNVSEQERQKFTEFNDTVTFSEEVSGTSIQTSAKDLVQTSRGIKRSSVQQFFSHIQRDMDLLIQQEIYLTRRVELERYALQQIQLISTPFESSFGTIAEQYGNHPHFPELIYLVSEFFPTLAPYKLIASILMEIVLLKENN